MITVQFMLAYALIAALAAGCDRLARHVRRQGEAIRELRRQVDRLLEVMEAQE